MNTSSGALVSCAEMSEALRLQAARLAADALPVVYAAAGPEAVPMLASEFLIPESELGGAVAIAQESVEGLVAAYPAREYQDRQRVSLHHALGNLSREAGSRLVAQLRLLAGTTPHEGLQGEYIARFAVRQDLRGRGTADRLMALILAHRPTVSLHVRADNARAISFYKRHGFAERAVSKDSILMVRSAGRS